MRRTSAGVICCFLSIFSSKVFGVLPFSFEGDRPRHLQLAEYVVDNIHPENDEFKTDPNFLYVPGLHKVDEVKSRNLCATFQTNLIRTAHGIRDDEFEAWTGYKSPFASTYYDLVVNENGFMRLFHVDEIEPGDFTFWKYRESRVTGHSMLISSKPVPARSSRCRHDQRAYAFQTIESSYGISRDRHYLCADEDGTISRRGAVFGRLTKFMEALP